MTVIFTTLRGFSSMRTRLWYCSIRRTETPSRRGTRTLRIDGKSPWRLNKSEWSCCCLRDNPCLEKNSLSVIESSRSDREVGLCSWALILLTKRDITKMDLKRREYLTIWLSSLFSLKQYEEKLELLSSYFLVSHRKMEIIATLE